MTSAEPGTYTLVLEVTESATIEVGALGEHRFDAGWYGYVGSAFGPGGLGRVERHRELARGERSTRHWHVDYLLGHDAACLRDAVTTPNADVECAVARALPDGPVAGFGSSDCDCQTHLGALPGSRETAREAVRRAHRRATDGTASDPE